MQMPNVFNHRREIIEAEPMMPMRTLAEGAERILVSHANTVFVENPKYPNSLVIEHTPPVEDVSKMKTKRLLPLHIGRIGMERLKAFGIDTIPTDEELSQDDKEWIYDEFLTYYEIVDVESDYFDKFTGMLMESDENNDTEVAWIEYARLYQERVLNSPVRGNENFRKLAEDITIMGVCVGALGIIKAMEKSLRLNLSDESLPLDSAGGLAGDVEDNSVNAADLVNYSGRNIS